MANYYVSYHHCFEGNSTRSTRLYKDPPCEFKKKKGCKILVLLLNVKVDGPTPRVVLVWILRTQRNRW